MPNISEPIYKQMLRFFAAVVILVSAVAAGCGGGLFKRAANTAAIGSLPAVRLNFRFEADVPAPTLPQSQAEERNAAIQSDFDANRPNEILERTLTSPDKKHVFAVYRLVADRDAEFRLDAYTPDGKLLKKVTSDAMAVHFPDTIRWSPDSTALAFVAMTRSADPAAGVTLGAPVVPAPADANKPLPEANTQLPAAAAPTPASPTGILTFRSEQIYICGANGDGVKPVTQNEGLIYFYYDWSPDSSMLAALAVTSREWDYFDGVAALKGENWTPVGRLRVVEKNGRERRLDDNLTAVRPVFSPDSAKIAIAFDTQVRIYDAGGNAPTQAGIPLKNQLLLSSQAYDDLQRRIQEQGVNAETNSSAVSTNSTVIQQSATLPDEKTLVSFNPIVQVEWTSDELLYLKTAYVKRMKNDADSVTSYARWHRLVFSGQAPTPTK